MIRLYASDKAYLENVKNFEALCQKVVQLSKASAKWNTQNQQKHYGYLVFLKICLTSTAVLRLLPRSKHFVFLKNLEIWDISSLCILTRSLMDSYFVFYYIAIDKPRADELMFRFILWRLNIYSEQRKMLQGYGPESSGLTQAENNIEKLSNGLRNNEFFKGLKAEEQKKCENGGVGIFIKGCLNSRKIYEEICKRRGIHKERFLSEYKYLSNYVHTHPFSIHQMSIFDVRNPKARLLFNRVIQDCVNFLSMAIRDYVDLFQDHKRYITPRIENILKSSENSLMLTQ